MCAVIGAIIIRPVSCDFDSLRNVFHESRIRGMHATGLSYVKGNKIVTEKHPVPADEFPFDFPNYVNEDGNLYLIGHCRYSTSDLKYNQPIANDDCSIVHNGVITQESPEHWKEMYNYGCETKNDSELVLHSPSPLEEFPDASMAVCELTSDKKLLVYRNGKRPIYLTKTSNGCIITSTLNIITRSKIKCVTTSSIPMNTYLTFNSDLTLEKSTVRTTMKDLQKVNYEISI